MDILKVLLLCSLWCTQCDSEFTSDVARLLRRVRMSPARVRLVPRVLRDVQNVLHTRWPNTEVTPFGSIIAGVSVESSDVDIYAAGPDTCPDVEEAKNVLDQYPHIFQNTRALRNLAPIVKFYHVPTGHSGDLSYASRDAARKTAWMKYYVNIDDRALNLTIIVRTWAKLHKPENIPQKRFMPNFAITTLVFFYLQQVQILPPVTDIQEKAHDVMINGYNFGWNEIYNRSSNHASLYELLGGFFKYYDQFDFENMIVSPYTGYPIPRSAFKNNVTLPECFKMYRNNLNNGGKLLNIESPAIIQDPFLHYKNNAAMTSTTLEKFKSDLKFAAEAFAMGRNNFLEVILNSALLQPDE